MSERGSRKGVSVEHSDYDRITDALNIAECRYREGFVTPRELYDVEYPLTGRRKTIQLTFETTTFVFDVKGRYLGRTYMARDECDYYLARGELGE